MAFVCDNGEWKLRAGSVDWSLAELAERLTRPAYVYDLDQVVERARVLRSGPARVHYAMKANAHPRLLGALRDLDMGVDVVSLGEMQKALGLGFAGQKIIFSGVAKDREDLIAALSQEIYQINVESFEELKALSEVAQSLKTRARLALRLNIHLSAPTHKNIQTATEESKFGLDIRLLPEVLAWLKGRPELELVGLAVHIGSQILDVGVFETMARTIGEVYNRVQREGFPLQRLDVGGGLGIDYESHGADDFLRLDKYFAALGKHGTNAQLVCEPGRFLVARSGVLLAKVVYVKRGLSKNFAILNAGMTCLMRPALYEAYHRIEPLRASVGAERDTYCVVGPICESTDTFAEARSLPRLKPGEWLGIFEAGAYGAVMANTYNETPLPEQWSLLDGRWEVL